MTATEVVLSFASEGQDEMPLRQAAYRMAGLAACQIDWSGDRWICVLTTSGQDAPDADTLRSRFLAVLNDENLRERIESRTAPIRDVIVALAFGALARDGSASV